MQKDLQTCIGYLRQLLPRTTHRTLQTGAIRVQKLGLITAGYRQRYKTGYLIMQVCVIVALWLRYCDCCIVPGI